MMSIETKQYHYRLFKTMIDAYSPSNSGYLFETDNRANTKAFRAEVREIEKRERVRFHYFMNRKTGNISSIDKH